MRARARAFMHDNLSHIPYATQQPPKSLMHRSHTCETALHTRIHTHTHINRAGWESRCRPCNRIVNYPKSCGVPPFVQDKNACRPGRPSGMTPEDSDCCSVCVCGYVDLVMHANTRAHTDTPLAHTNINAAADACIGLLLACSKS